MDSLISISKGKLQAMTNQNNKNTHGEDLEYSSMVNSVELIHNKTLYLFDPMRNLILILKS
jgi:hypothetical protein